MIFLILVALVVIIFDFSSRFLSDDLSKLLYSDEEKVKTVEDESSEDSDKVDDKKDKEKSKKKKDKILHPDMLSDEEISSENSKRKGAKDKVTEVKEKVKNKKKRTYKRLSKEDIKNHALRILKEVYDEGQEKS